MSFNIWTRCAGDSELRPLRLTPWRVVEAQHQLSTRKLVDSAEEQMLLEELIEGVKPLPPRAQRLHYLLSTPFRYPPLARGSRFGTRRERGLWYGSESRRTAFAEVAYYRLLFLEGTHAPIGNVTTTLTAFTVRARSSRGIDLTSPSFESYRQTFASPVDYTPAQALGTAMRSAGVELFRYPAARDVAGGVNVGIFSPAAFGAAQPRGFESWYCTASRARVEIVSGPYARRQFFGFPREDFLIEGSLPAPAL